jgi:hypothetical protein
LPSPELDSAVEGFVEDEEDPESDPPVDALVGAGVLLSPSAGAGDFRLSVT